MPIDPSTAFVSYSRDDRDFVLRLGKDLKAKGLRIWIDQLDILPGQRWEEEIEAAVSSCSKMLVILSPAAIASKNVLAEASFAIDEGKQVVPVLYRDCKVPFRLRPFQYADFRDHYDSGLEELLVTLSAGRDETTGTKRELLQDAPGPPTSELLVPARPWQIAAFDRYFHAARSPARATSSTVAEPSNNTSSGQTPPPSGVSGKTAETLKNAEAGNATAMVDLAWDYHQGDGVPQDYERALYWYEKAAKAGNAQGMYNMGVNYERGFGVPIDYATAIKWYTRAASAGAANAMNNLGVMYRDGIGVPVNTTEAGKLFRQAAEEGNVNGMTNIGWLYLEGVGVTKDYGQALEWTHRGAESGAPQAMNNLGWMYQNGYGVAANRDEAINWYRKAAKLGNDQAKTNLKNLGEQPQ